MSGWLCGRQSFADDGDALWSAAEETGSLFEEMVLQLDIHPRLGEPATWVPRRLNRVADALAGLAMQRKRGAFWQDAEMKKGAREVFCAGRTLA